MANTTFKGTLRSEGGYSSIATAANTGVETTQMSISSAGFASLDANTLATTAGTGITTGTGTVYAASVIKTGGIFHTKILIDLTGLAAVNGTVLGGKLTCLEAPAGGDPDINLWYADEATGTEDAAITGLTNQVQMCDSGDLALNSVISIPTPPAADKYIYMVTGAATNANYTAGKLLIEFFGYEA